ncbi:hypothetical protein GGF50DRAFT_119976 [Schizophyllum commune]
MSLLDARLASDEDAQLAFDEDAQLAFDEDAHVPPKFMPPITFSLTCGVIRVGSSAALSSPTSTWRIHPPQFRPGGSILPNLDLEDPFSSISAWRMHGRPRRLLSTASASLHRRPRLPPSTITTFSTTDDHDVFCRRSRHPSIDDRGFPPSTSAASSTDDRGILHRRPRYPPSTTSASLYHGHVAVAGLVRQLNASSRINHGRQHVSVVVGMLVEVVLGVRLLDVVRGMQSLVVVVGMQSLVVLLNGPPKLLIAYT